MKRPLQRLTGIFRKNLFPGTPRNLALPGSWIAYNQRSPSVVKESLAGGRWQGIQGAFFAAEKKSSQKFLFGR
jgi:hypothetical protein